MSGRELLDPRYHWLMDAARRIYGQLDCNERMISLTVLSGSADGELLASQITYHGPVTRLLIPDQSTALSQGEEFLTDGTVSLMPDS